MAMDRPIPVVFFRLDSDREPVRDWLKGLSRNNRKSIGEDIKTPANELTVAKRRLTKLRS